MGWYSLHRANSPHHHRYGDGTLLQMPPTKKQKPPHISIIRTYLVCVCVCLYVFLWVSQTKGAGLLSRFSGKTNS